MTAADPWLFNAKMQLHHAQDYIKEALISLEKGDPPWDQADHALRLTKQKLSVAAVDLAAARTRFAQELIDSERSFNDGIDEEVPQEDPDDPV